MCQICSVISLVGAGVAGKSHFVDYCGAIGSSPLVCAPEWICLHNKQVLIQFCEWVTHRNSVVCYCVLNGTGRTEGFAKIPYCCIRSAPSQQPAAAEYLNKTQTHIFL